MSCFTDQARGSSCLEHDKVFSERIGWNLVPPHSRAYCASVGFGFPDVVEVSRSFAILYHPAMFIVGVTNIAREQWSQFGALFTGVE